MTKDKEEMKGVCYTFKDGGIGVQITDYDEECAGLEACQGLAARRVAYDKNGDFIKSTLCKRHMNFGYKDDD